MTSHGRQDLLAAIVEDGELGEHLRAGLHVLDRVAGEEPAPGEVLDLVVRALGVLVAVGEELLPARRWGRFCGCPAGGGMPSTFVSTGGSSIFSRSEPGIGFR